MEVDGVVYEADGEIVADVADVPVDIAGDKPITVDGRAYRVLAVMPHPDKVGVTITLKAVARRARVIFSSRSARRSGCFDRSRRRRGRQCRNCCGMSCGFGRRT